MSELSYLSHARYGKDKVRVFRVVRDGAWHNVFEYNVTALVEGDIEISYTKADNTVVVATDSIKNITYYLAKTSPHVLHPERFALHLGTHLVSKYAHLKKAFITIEQLRWQRIPIAQGEGQTPKPHSHAFYRDGDDTRVVEAEIDATAGKDKIVAHVTSGVRGLLVLKTTGSAFESFVRDEYTTLVEVDDRIFSTSIDLTYKYAPLPIPAPADGEGKVFDYAPTAEAAKGTAWDGDAVAAVARDITLEVFALDESASVQATLYKMAQRMITEQQHVLSVTYKLPNKHYVPVDMKYIGIDNMSPPKAEVFLPLSAPSGLISATVSRK
ncbi:uricase [Trametes versicolor FP-101664 SS1]|uniref:uricase n=1 Tax=Trametes versicolor (strain FP-101664) TaxID=717944 RepID=UPI000462488E|nr:uricase [Trametes versicolor FP-101664 SS1]EIW52188.1 uricase [Trametes versicolor FP-101664 SS1]